MSWDKDVTQLDSLAAALTVLRQIPMKNMRHGKRLSQQTILEYVKICVYLHMRTFMLIPQESAVCCGRFT